MLDMWIFDHVSYSRANRCVSYAFLEHASLATESPITFSKISLCPGFHCIMICLFSCLNLSGSRLLEFPSRAAHGDWESGSMDVTLNAGVPVKTARQPSNGHQTPPERRQRSYVTMLN